VLNEWTIGLGKSLVFKFAIGPLFPPCFFPRGEVSHSESAMTFAVEELTLDTDSFLAFIFSEFAVFNVHVPETLIYLIFCHGGVLASTIFLTIAIVAFVDIAVGVDK